MSCEFETQDYEGKPVRCSHWRWEEHIAAKHAELADQQEAVRITISHPEHKYRSGRFPRRKLYYRRNVLPLPYEREYLLVIVNYPASLEGEGRVLSAYKTRRIKDGDDLI